MHFKTEAERERLEAMFKSMTPGSRRSAQDLLRSANDAEAVKLQKLKDLFQLYTQTMFGGYFDSIIETHYYEAAGQPDFILHFREFLPENFPSLKGMEIGAKMLTTDQNIESFRKSEAFRGAKGRMLVVQIDQNTSVRDFNKSFRSELSRIDDLLNGSES